jgi:regulator of RNase E activity RraA
MIPRLVVIGSLAVAGWGQSELVAPKAPYQIPAYVMERLKPADRELFGKLAQVSIEGVWALLQREGYHQCFIHELDALHPDRRLIGRARTIRYLPNRPDLRQKIYSQRKQLNYVSAEEAEPGDVLVFDAGGETRAAVTGDVTTTRFLYKGGNGVIVDGALRDVPEFAQMPFQVFLRRGQAAAVSPVLMSVDYQVPVRIGSVTVAPGDILLGDRHGILVIPAHLAPKLVEEAIDKEGLEEFQRKLLLEGESIYTVYPANDDVRRRYEEYKKQKR